MIVGKLRRAKGLTQEQLALLAGVKLSTLQKIERADKMPPGTSVEVAVRLARELGTSVEEIAEIPK